MDKSNWLTIPYTQTQNTSQHTRFAYKHKQIVCFNGNEFLACELQTQTNKRKIAQNSFYINYRVGMRSTHTHTTIHESLFTSFRRWKADWSKCEAHYKQLEATTWKAHATITQKSKTNKNLVKVFWIIQRENWSGAYGCDSDFKTINCSFSLV